MNELVQHLCEFLNSLQDAAEDQSEETQERVERAIIGYNALAGTLQKTLHVISHLDKDALATAIEAAKACEEEGTPVH